MERREVSSITRPAASNVWSEASAIGIGELLWDLLPGGARLGGAPFNVVAHLRQLGCRAHFVTAVGVDDLGRRALDEVASLGIDASLVEMVDVPTGVVRVRVDDGGVPTYEIASPAAYESLAPMATSTVATLLDTQILVFGTLAQRFPGVITTTRLVARELREAVRLYDVNLRDGCWNRPLVEELLGLANLIKLNEAEQWVLARELMLPVASTEEFARAAAERFGLRGVCVTRGPEGAALLLDGQYAEAPAIPVRVADTVGAGDAFAAGLVAGVLAAWSVEAVLNLGSRLASVVVSSEGAVPFWSASELGLDQP